VTTTYAYDADGDETAETHHYGYTATWGFSEPAGTTSKWYDGSDRLVEVQLPLGQQAAESTFTFLVDEWTMPWTTRYIYDLSQGQGSAIPGASYQAYGNLAHTEDYLPSTDVGPTWSWTATKGTAFDGVDRPVTQYAYAPTAAFAPMNMTPYSTSLRYDGTGQAGLLSSRTDGLGQVLSYGYDAAGELTSLTYSNLQPGTTTSNEQLTYDPDGNVSTATSATFGTQTNAYDTTGILLSRAVPALGLTPSTTLKYDYYPDDSNRDVIPSSVAMTIAWSYRADGLRQTTGVTYGGATYSLKDQYTAAGRHTTATDPFGGSSESYGSDGQLASYTVPAGSFTALTHDPEGELASFKSYADLFPPSGTTVQALLSIRGELLGEFFNPDFSGQQLVGLTTYDGASALGYLDPHPKLPTPQIPKWWDVRDRLPVTYDSPTGGEGLGFSYDAIGRQIGSNIGWSWTTNNGNDISQDGSFSKTYDAENRLLSESLTNYDLLGTGVCPGEYLGGNEGVGTTASPTYAWNVDSHPWTVNGYGVVWSDGQPLIVFNPTGTVNALYVDDRAFLQPGVSSPMVVVDRDLSGMIASWHDASGYGGLSASAAYMTNCIGKTGIGTTSTRSPYLPISEPRPDGIWDGINTIQGVRTYDPLSTTWSTPDVDQGDLADPASQLAYMWNRNNPYLYSDPSGFYPCDQTAVISGEEAAKATKGLGGAIGCVSTAPRRQPTRSSGPAGPPTAAQASGELEHFNFLQSRDSKDFAPNAMVIAGMAGADGLGEAPAIAARAAAGSRNVATRIGGRLYTGHALDRMEERGLVPMVVEDIIAYPTRTGPGRTAGTTLFENGNGSVVLNSSGHVVTVWHY